MMIVAIPLLSSFMKSEKWELACQAYTFKEFALSEALAKMQSLGITSVELYPNQVLTPGGKFTTYFTMSAEEMKALKALLKKHHVNVKSYGVVSPDKEADWILLFEFARAMGIKTIVSEPKQENLDFVDSLCQKYKIRVAIHNHPEPTPYWDPEIVLKALDGRSEYMGVCADVGHWTRSGLDATECLKKLEGRLFEIHMKDVNKTDKTGHAVVWGQGIIDWDSVFDELRRQNFSGKFVIEHETNWTNPVPDLKENLTFFKAQLSEK